VHHQALSSCEIDVTRMGWHVADLEERLAYARERCEATIALGRLPGVRWVASSKSLERRLGIARGRLEETRNRIDAMTAGQIALNLDQSATN
jgi:hypothetical protein